MELYWEKAAWISLRLCTGALNTVLIFDTAGFIGRGSETALSADDITYINMISERKKSC